MLTTAPLEHPTNATPIGAPVVLINDHGQPELTRLIATPTQLGLDDVVGVGLWGHPGPYLLRRVWVLPKGASAYTDEIELRASRRYVEAAICRAIDAERARDMARQGAEERLAEVRALRRRVEELEEQLANLTHGRNT